jgi:hypothetical protein
MANKVSCYISAEIMYTCHDGGVEIEIVCRQQRKARASREKIPGKHYRTHEQGWAMKSSTKLNIETHVVAPSTHINYYYIFIFLRVGRANKN